MCVCVWFANEYLVRKIIFKQANAHLFNTVKGFQVLLFIVCTQFKWFYVILSNTNNSIYTQLNDFEYCYLTPIILFNINHLFDRSQMVSSIVI